MDDDEDILDDDEDLITRIRHFLAEDNHFREPEFDPAPYLIKVLKEKEANQELLVQKQSDLIELENKAQALIADAASEKSQQFLSTLELPDQFGVQLQKLKHGMAKVKKKVKETKSLLLATQKDIQQIHLNCMFNKMIYKSLKEIELKLAQYETAALALKNHLYLDCANNLPTFTGTSALESALAARTENLKLRFLSQAIEEVRLFLYFTPRVTAPTQHSFIDKLDGSQEIFNEATHANFYKRYFLFKKARCEEYLSSIWSLAALDERNGKIATIDGIIKGIIRINKVNQIIDSLSLDCKKSVSNIFTVLYYFFAKEQTLKKKLLPSKKAWFTSPQTPDHIIFLSALFCVSAALIRKSVIVRRICSQYQLRQVCDRLASQKLLEIVRDEIVGFVLQVYFPQPQNAPEIGAQDPLAQVRQPNGYTLWPFFKKKVEACFTILSQQLAVVQKNLFSLQFPESYHYLKAFTNLQKQFKELFHLQLLKQFQSIFPEGRGLIPQNYDSILSLRDHRPHEIQFCNKFVSEERKSLRQFVNFISLLTSMAKYFNENNFDPEGLRLYSAFMLIFFYLKINSAIFRSLISPSAYDKVYDARLKDPKLKNKEKHIETTFAALVQRKQKRKIEKKFKIVEGDSVPLRNAEQLKMLKNQMEMLLQFCLKELTPTSDFVSSPSVDRVEGEIDKHEPSNYDDNLSTKLLRVWEQLVKPMGEGEGIELLLAGVYRRLTDLYLSVSASVYLETGSF